MDDSISRQAAIQEAKELFRMGDCYCDEHSIVGMLNSLPSVQSERKTDWDTVSRRMAIDAINHICPIDTEYDCALLDRVDVRQVLSALPSAQPEKCGDAVSREEAKWVVFCHRDNVCDQANAIDELPSVRPSAQPEPRWIPVNERLPKDERYVLVTTVSGDVTEAKYWQKEGFWVLKGLAIMSVTAWMPLPTAYERSEDGSKTD